MHKRWFFISLAFLGILINFFDRSALGYAIEPIKASFNLNNTQFGLIASAFAVGYTLLVIFTGHWIDLLGSRRIWFAGAILWSIFMILLGLASGFWWLYCLRFLLGAAETCSFTGLTKVSASWLAPSERAWGLALGLAAVPFASVLGAPLISSLIIAWGWRGGFITLGLMGIVWGIIWAICYREPIRHDQIAFKTPDISTFSWKEILFNPRLMSNNYAFFSFGYLLYFAITWLPGYFEQTYGLHLKQIGWFLVVPWVFATITILLGGLFSDYLWRKTSSLRLARSHMIWISQIIAACCFIPVIFIHSVNVALTFITLGIGFGLLPNAAFYALHVDLMPSRAATSLAVMSCAFGLAGLLATGLTGWLTTITNNFNAAIWLLIFFTITSAIGIIIFQRNFSSEKN